MVLRRFLILSCLPLAVVLTGCGGGSYLADEGLPTGDLHVTATCDVTVLTSTTSAPIVGASVYFYTWKAANASASPEAAFSFVRTTNAYGKASVTVGYNIRPDQSAFISAGLSSNPSNQYVQYTYAETSSRYNKELASAPITKTLTIRTSVGK